jgi:hypothetical protein
MPIPRLACMLPFPGAWLLAFFARCGTVVAPLWHFGVFGPKRRDATFGICVPHAYLVVAIGGLEPPTSRL